MVKEDHGVIWTTPCIELAAIPQLAEARSKEDDWTGTKDAATRRRVQTRLNTRAYRKRKTQVKTSEPPSETAGTPMKSEAFVEYWDIKQECVSVIPASRIKDLYNARDPLLSDAPRSGQFKAVFPLCPDHLITLLQFNALRALAVNRTLISGILATPLEWGAEVVHIVPYPTNPKLLPSTLLPTMLQQTVLHSDCIDLFPDPEGRDSMIRAAGNFDMENMFADCIGGLYEGFPDDEIERRGVVAWYPPWDIAGWEMSEAFMTKWGWLLGSTRALEATNRWRAERSEEVLSSTYYISSPPKK
ncbi:hypothetical protein P154DRAFT_482876 [Amniculicola lignicola CBS 123094]|uniref:Uncharacterized protein n=1 Tax=Amniculicola lignicola CBS 123094 TaxID=1392246 RepID=A0A6A5WZC6_9PLEO|nr:hypothetical protein P154DRAFT_482876 [Amniculicola lignicola CBS 123094]